MASLRSAPAGGWLGAPNLVNTSRLREEPVTAYSMPQTDPLSLVNVRYHCEVLRKYSRPAGKGALSMRSDMTACRFEAARSTSLST